MFSFKSIFNNTNTDKEVDKSYKQFDTLKYDGVRAFRTGYMDYAVNCFKQALEISDDLEIWDYLSQTYLKMGLLKEAYDCLLHLANAQGNNEKIYIRMASVAYMLEDYEKEQQISQKILDLNQNSAEGHFLLAQSYIGQSNNVLAIAMLSKAISIDNNFFSAYLLRGQILLKMGDLSGVAADVDILLEKIPDNEDVLLLAARVAKSKNKLSDALNYYNQLIDTNPFSIEGYRERGSIKYELGDKEGAEADARAALEIEPSQVSDINGKYSSQGTEKIQCK